MTVHSAFPGNGGAGLHVAGNATLANMESVAIDGFDVGIEAADRGVVDCGTGTTITNFIQVAAFATNGSISFGTPILVDGLGSASTFGFRAINGGAIFAGASTASNCNTCFDAEDHGEIFADGSTAAAGTAGEFAYIAQYAGIIECTGSSATGSFSQPSGYLWLAVAAGFIHCSGFTGTSAQIGTSITGTKQPGFVEWTE